MTTDAIVEAEPILPRFDPARVLNAATGGRAGDIARLSMEIVKLRRGAGRLSKEEYCHYRLYDATLSWRDKLAFVGADVEKILHLVVNDHQWAAAAHDKMLFYALAGAFDLPVPQTVAAWRRGWRTAAPYPVFRDRDAVAALLRDRAAYPLFGKPVAEMRSTGVAQLEDYQAEDDAVRLKGGRTVGVDALVEALGRYADAGYLLQKLLAPSDQARAVAGDALTTLRLVLRCEDGEVHPFRAIWKLPTGVNPADNFWRPGNIGCAVERDSGRIVRAVAGVGPDQQVLDHHPETGALLTGTVVPHFDEAVALASRAATAFHGLALQAWDVALAEGGPVLMEVNLGGDFSLPQAIEGRGLLDAEFVGFVERRAAALNVADQVAKMKLRRALG